MLGLMYASTAELFVAEANARGVLLRLGEVVPEALAYNAILNRHGVGAQMDTEGHRITFVDGSRAEHAASGHWRASERVAA